MQMNTKVSISWEYCFCWKWPDMSKVPRTVSWQCFCKECCSILVFYCDAKHSDILRVSSHVYCYLFLRTARLEIFCLIRPCDTNNFTHNLTRKYHHTATESLYRLCDEKISLDTHLSRSVLLIWFVPFPICLECEISGSSVFSFFFHEV